VSLARSQSRASWRLVSSAGGSTRDRHAQDGSSTDWSGVNRRVRDSLCEPARKGMLMNNIIYLVGLVVVILAVLAFFGLR
jgi:hypothetical protein